MTANVPVGSVVAWCGQKDAIPDGWLYCDGTILGQNGQYNALFVVIGHAFGNPPPSPNFDPTTQFYLPDFRGYFLRAVDDGAHRDPDTNQRYDMQNAGTYPNPGPPVEPTRGSVQYDQFRWHTHGYEQSQYFGSGNWDGSDWNNGAAQTEGTGGNESRPLNAYVYYIIKYA